MHNTEYTTTSFDHAVCRLARVPLTCMSDFLDPARFRRSATILLGKTSRLPRLLLPLADLRRLSAQVEPQRHAHFRWTPDQAYRGVPSRRLCLESLELNLLERRKIDIPSSLTAVQKYR